MNIGVINHLNQYIQLVYTILYSIYTTTTPVIPSKHAEIHPTI